MKQGSLFEQLVTQVEELLKSDSNFEVLPNTTLEDRDGIKRQIDILIKQKVDERFTYDTIIECKDHAGKINVGLVGTFINLMESLNMHQGIFVSKNGFQKSAIKKARANSRVKLYTLSEIVDPAIFTQVKNNIKELHQAFQLISYSLVADEELCKTISFPQSISNPLLRIDTSDECKTPLQLVEMFIKENVKTQYEPVWQRFIMNPGQDLDWKLKVREHLVSDPKMFVTVGIERIYLKSVFVEYDLWLVEKESTVTSIHRYQDHGSSQDMAYNIATEMDVSSISQKIKFNLVKTADGKKTDVFMKLEDGTIEKLKHLAIIDPKAGTITPIEN